jgi:arsenite-transporting ATPase
VVSTDPAGSLSEIFGQPITHEPTSITERLYAQQIDATAEFDRMRTQYRSTVERVFESLGLEHAAQLDRRVVETLFDFAPPGIDEIIALVEILEHANDYDAMIIDSAPTGHFLRLLAMPDIALEWVHALLRLLLKYHAAASLDALGRDLLAFAKRLRELKFDAVYVVTLPEPMVMAETQRLATALEAAEIPIAAVILNHAVTQDTRPLSGRFGQQIIRAPDTGSEIIGTAALHNFLMQWHLEERAGD